MKCNVLIRVGVVIGILALACNAATVAPKAISVEGDVIKIDGKVITSKKKTEQGPRVNISLKATESVLGSPEREHRPNKSKCFYIWDAFGMEIAEWQDSIFSVIVHFSAPHFVAKEGESESARDARLYVHNLNKALAVKSDYEGTVSINGIQISKGTRLSTIEPALQRVGFKFDRVRHEAELERDYYEVFLRWQEDDETMLNFSFRVAK
jgi:hypothetical protein